MSETAYSIDFISLTNDVNLVIGSTMERARITHIASSDGASAPSKYSQRPAGTTPSSVVGMMLAMRFIPTHVERNHPIV